MKKDFLAQQRKTFDESVAFCKALAEYFGDLKPLLTVEGDTITIEIVAPTDREVDLTQCNWVLTTRGSWTLQFDTTGHRTHPQEYLEEHLGPFGGQTLRTLGIYGDRVNRLADLVYKGLLYESIENTTFKSEG